MQSRQLQIFTRLRYSDYKMLLELFVVFLKLGTFTIGGGVAMIPILRDSMVNEKEWFTDEEMVDIIAICQSLPGVIAINMATYVGFRKKGLSGSLVATLGVIIPSFLIILMLAKGIAAIGDNPRLMGGLAGLRAAATGMVILAIYRMAKSVANGWVSGLLAVMSFVLIAFFDVSVALVVLVYLVGGALFGVYGANKMKGGDGNDS